MKKRKPGGKVLIATLGVLLLLIPFTGCTAGEAEKETIVFGEGNWDSSQLHSRIAAFILENGYGYQSEFVPGDTIPLFAGLVSGDLDVEMEIWVENQQEAYDKAIAAGQVVDLGTNFPDSFQGWLVPTYVIKGDPARGIEPMAPDLKAIDDLPQYWELFKDPEVPTKGRFYNGVPGWESTGHNTQKLKTYGLDEYFTNFLPGSDAAMSASMVAAYGKGEPWLGYYWEPTWVLGKLDMTPIEELPFDQEIWEATRGCNFPTNKVNIAVNSSLPDRAPEVVEFLRKYETTTAMVNEMLSYIQENEASTGEAAIYFLQEYESLWTSWVPSDVASKVKAALP